MPHHSITERKEQMSDQPKQNPPVLFELAKLEERIAKLDAVCRDIVERVGSVLAPEPPTPHGDPTVAKGGNSNLAAKLAGFNVDIEIIINRIVSATTRIEL